MPHGNFVSVTPWTQSVIDNTSGPPKSSKKLQLQRETAPGEHTFRGDIPTRLGQRRQADPSNGRFQRLNGGYAGLSGRKKELWRICGKRWRTVGNYCPRIARRSNFTRFLSSSLASIKLFSS